MCGYGRGVPVRGRLKGRWRQEGGNWVEFSREGEAEVAANGGKTNTAVFMTDMPTISVIPGFSLVVASYNPRP